MKKIHNAKLVDEASSFIYRELMTLLDRNNYDSHLNRRLADCPAYRNGLTIGDTQLALLRALCMMQLVVTADVASMWRDNDEDDDDYGEAVPTEYVFTDTDLIKQIAASHKSQGIRPASKPAAA